MSTQESGMTERLGKEVLYPLQEAVMARLQAMNDPQMVQAKLCGGTALSRFWLNHRISYDLDFFLPHGFKAMDMSMALKQAGIDYDTRDIVDDPRKANQLHGYVIHQGQSLKVSFVEDAYFDLFPAVEKKLGAALVRTEEIPGLFHRKLRTVAGGGSEGDAFEGGRQKARDVFDLYVLSVAFKPIREFMASLPYSFPADAFDNGLANMPWFDLMGELDEIACDGKWAQAKDVAFLQEALFAQIGATALIDDLAKEPSPPEPPGPAK
jgi:hypothetical protein